MFLSLCFGVDNHVVELVGWPIDGQMLLCVGVVMTSAWPLSKLIGVSTVFSDCVPVATLV